MPSVASASSRVNPELSTTTSPSSVRTNPQLSMIVDATDMKVAVGCGVGIVVGVGDGSGNVTWPDLNTTTNISTMNNVFKVFPGYNSGDETTNPELISVNISSALDSLTSTELANIYIRFHWTGTWGYAWYVDDVSISGARGVLINITGGMDLAIDEVTTISSIIQEEAGDDAEIIFGAVHNPELKNQVRVTVIATGFDSGGDEKVIPGDFRSPRSQLQVSVPAQEPAASGVDMLQQAMPEHSVLSEVVPQELEAQVAVAGGGGGGQLPLARYPERFISRKQIEGLDIPTFIRRQMD